MPKNLEGNTRLLSAVCYGQSTVQCQTRNALAMVGLTVTDEHGHEGEFHDYFAYDRETLVKLHESIGKVLEQPDVRKENTHHD